MLGGRKIEFVGFDLVTLSGVSISSSYMFLAYFGADDARAGVFSTLGSMIGTLGGEAVDVLAWYFLVLLFLC